MGERGSIFIINAAAAGHVAVFDRRHSFRCLKFKSVSNLRRPTAISPRYSMFSRSTEALTDPLVTLYFQ